ncbi:MAG: 3-oxoacyl-[acyl-carrier-protein] synthase III C-terminal domain-containing protein [Alphaproteobacteria bacterium]
MNDTRTSSFRTRSEDRAAPPRLAALATAVPDHVLHQDKVATEAASFFGKSFGAFDRLAPVYRNAEIETRYSCVPIDWYTADTGFKARNDLFLVNAVELLSRAAEQAIAEAGLAPADIDMVVTVSSTGIATPSLDALLMQRLALRADAMRLPVFGLGCAGGVMGLGRAGAMAQAMPGKRILLLVVELCGLTFRANDRSKSNVIATALFGDGAAAAVISTAGDGPALTGWGEHLWRDTLDIMGWDVRDDGLAVVFSRDIPHYVRENMRAPIVDFLAQHDLRLADIDRFVCHPGGAKVLDALEEIFERPAGDLAESRDTLRHYGNMSAVTVLFVLREAMARAKADETWLLTSLGPGFSAAFALMES